LKGKRKKNFYLTITPKELKQFLILESKIVQLERQLYFRDSSTDQLQINNKLSLSFSSYINSTLYLKVKNYFKLATQYNEAKNETNDLFNNAMSNLQNNKFDFKISNNLKEYNR